MEEMKTSMKSMWVALLALMLFFTYQAIELMTFAALLFILGLGHILYSMVKWRDGMLKWYWEN